MFTDYSETSHSEHPWLVNTSLEWTHFPGPIFPIYFTIGEIARFVLGEHPSTVNSERFLFFPKSYLLCNKHLSLVNTNCP